MPFYRPAGMAREVVPQADMLLMTGTTLLNDTLEDLLSWARPEARVTMVGPTVGLLPDAFLRRGADILGGVQDHPARRLPRPAGRRRLRLPFLRPRRRKDRAGPPRREARAAA